MRAIGGGGDGWGGRRWAGRLVLRRRAAPVSQDVQQSGRVQGTYHAEGEYEYCADECGGAG